MSFIVALVGSFFLINHFRPSLTLMGMGMENGDRGVRRILKVSRQDIRSLGDFISPILTRPSSRVILRQISGTLVLVVRLFFAASFFGLF